MKQYAEVERIRHEMEGDPSLPARQDEAQTQLLYAASTDVFFTGTSLADRRAIPKGVTLESANELVKRVQRSSFAARHYPKFFAGPLTTVDNDVSAIEDTLDFRLNQIWGGPTKFEGAFTDTEGPQKHTGPATIHLADNGFAMQPQVVLHELAHAVEAFERPDRGVGNLAAHGARFARTNVTLIREFLSPEKAMELEDAFSFAGVKVAPETQDQPHFSLR